MVNSRNGVDRKIFFQNVGKLLPNFKMTRQGPFKGVSYSSGMVKDPNGQIKACWEGVGDSAVKLRDFLNQENPESRARVLVEISPSDQKEVASDDYGDVILLMASEIAEWEQRSEAHLESCDPSNNFTLPAVYNVMAMKAKP